MLFPLRRCEPVAPYNSDDLFEHRVELAQDAVIDHLHLCQEVGRAETLPEAIAALLTVQMYYLDPMDEALLFDEAERFLRRQVRRRKGILANTSLLRELRGLAGQFDQSND